MAELFRNRRKWMYADLTLIAGPPLTVRLECESILLAGEGALGDLTSNQRDKHQMTILSPVNSEETFYLIDHDGFRRVPRIINARDGRRGFAIHPTGKGNDTSAAHFTEDLKTLVQEVVMNGKGVRTRAKGGPKDGQQNTLYLRGSSIRGYWLHPDHLDWVKGGVQPVF